MQPFERQDYDPDTNDWVNENYPLNPLAGRSPWGKREDWWSAPGPHVGKGPRGYSRSDAQIRDEVSRRLALNGDLDASDIEVNVNARTVTLDGSVDSRRSKVLAEDIADSVWGVQDVHNHLSIRAAPQVPAGEVLDTLPATVFEGEPVLGSLGRHVGWVRRVYADDFVLARPGAADLHVPFDAVQDTYGDRVRLRVRAEQLSRQGWLQMP